MLRILMAVTIVLSCVDRSQAQDNTAGQVVSGNARFTVITPNLVRIEYDEHRKFVDDRSLFAVNRDVRAPFKRDDGIDTGAIRLRFPDNPSLNDIRAQIRNGDGWVNWSPGQKNEHNLGGTLRTLDGVSGVTDVGEGILSRDGWYLLDDSKTPLLTNDGWVRSRANDAGTDWYLFGYGTDYRAALKSLTTVSGAVPLPRRYQLGAWYSRYWPYTSKDYHDIVREYADHDFPLDVIVMDMDWHITDLPGVKRAHAGQIWTGYTWDKKLIPDAEALLKWFHEQGLHVTLNDHPADGVQPHEAMYDAFMRAMGDDPSTKKTIPFDAGSRKYLDTFWKITHQPLLDAGVDFWWLDWQQYPFTRSIPDLTNLWWLNDYYYQHTSSGGQRGASFSRWGGWGDHRHPIHFSGDAATNWETLAFEVPFTSTAGNVGCFFWSHDIGGHMGGRNEESYVRWCQFGALSAALRSHSTRDANMDRRPWKYPKWAEDSMRKSFHLRSELFPYIYSSVAQSCRESVPLTRPMYIDYPDDENAYHNPQQFMFGDHLLVAPIASPGTGEKKLARQIVWFPPGDAWFDFFTGERFEGGSQRLIECDIDWFPLFVRSGIPIAMRRYTARMASDKLETLVVRVYPTGDDRKVFTSTLYEDDGISRGYERGECATTDLSAVRDQGRTTVTIAPAKGRYEGQPASREIVVQLPDTAPAGALVNGQRAPNEDVLYDLPTQMTEIRVHNVPIDRACVVVSSADYAAQKASTRAVCGLIARNVSPILAPGQVQYVFFAPPLAINDNALHWSLDDGPKQVAPLDGSGATILSLPASASRPFHKRVLRVEYTLRGQTRADELPLPFDQGILTDASNVARLATASASSCESGYSPSGAINGIANGYPHAKRDEWASNHEKAGATLTLQWKEPQRIDTILLFDRPNPTDQITAAVIRFDDGSTRKLDALPNDGQEPLEVRFEPKTVRSLELQITGVGEKTQNAGLAEIAVFRAP